MHQELCKLLAGDRTLDLGNVNNHETNEAVRILLMVEEPGIDGVFDQAHSYGALLVYYNTLMMSFSGPKREMLAQRVASAEGMASGHRIFRISTLYGAEVEAVLDYVTHQTASDQLLTEATG